MGFLVSHISTSERRRGRADEVVGLRFSRGSSSNSVFTVFGWLAYFKFVISVSPCLVASAVVLLMNSSVDLGFTLSLLTIIVVYNISLRFLPFGF